MGAKRAAGCLKGELEMWLADQIEVAKAGFGGWEAAVRGFLRTEKRALLLVFVGDPAIYAQRLSGENGVVVFRQTGVLHRLMGALHLYVYGLKGQPVFPCGAILLDRKVAQLALEAGGRGLTPLVKAIRRYEDQAGHVRYVELGSGTPAFPLWVFLSKVVFPGLLESSLIRFMAVGVTGVLVNLGALDLQVRLLGLYSSPYLAVPLAFELSVLWNFLLNNRFTFGAKDVRKVRFAEYNASTLGSFFAQLAAVYLLTTRAHIHQYLLASMVGIVVGFFINYTVSLFIWRKPVALGPSAAPGREEPSEARIYGARSNKHHEEQY